VPSRSKISRAWVRYLAFVGAGLRREVEITYQRTFQAMTSSVEVPIRWQAVECSDESSPDCGCMDDAGRVDRSRCCYPELWFTG
jgi:hypothetical protein